MFGGSDLVSSSSPKRVNSVSVRVRSSRIKVRIFGMARFSFDSVYLWLGSRLSNSTRSDSVQLGPPRFDLVHHASTQSGGSTFRCEDLEYCRMHASKSRLGNDIPKSYLTSSAQEYSGCISKTRHGWNRRTMKSRVLSGRSFSRRLRLFASAVQ
ncbi:hypothetical protein HanRHA438_Chr11g0507651 [Helianthus annuus]|uniref:uncharacterized protein LOC110877894 n=1 Tax=Helianthus annuus TaxID=4232 RepID=UPI0016532A10|nr:uncharacterized protein LOC110877894 [Helianthus annuus]KAJ0501858.1 hypothetical protein HanHA300_Chr11g0405941 [Helianthus annuus]KAJ0509780.1 hypothetical protein HanIR_Chr11g0533031 [Helianthus annuus]KAJ0517787.1 hypothetical protein HanHA89_Chr11g0429681 [Helianthus annuus]KAJ0685804.1 hypothetical protein HanLR1_Chr11g0407181 [Helianthus annuus]KAJ0689674.1 hypothetical protein HanOQP8_Chr11g0408761 [Helianthus annuus]